MTAAKMSAAVKEQANEAAEEQLWRIAQVCATLGVGRTKAYELEQSGRLKGVRIDGALRFRKSDVLAFIAGLGK